MTIAIVTLLVFICSFVLWISKMRRNTKYGAPEARGSWPVIGHLHLLGGPRPAHTVFGEMADKYGPIFTIKIGMRPALIVSNWEIAKECLTTHDKTLANRPNFIAVNHFSYDGSMLGFSPYGDYWRKIRKIAITELLSNNQLEMFKHVRESEIKTALKHLYDLWQENNMVEMQTWFGDITLNALSRISVGKSVGYGNASDQGWKQVMRDFFRLAASLVPADGLPFLRWLDIGGLERRVKKASKQLEFAIKEQLEEHKRKKAFGVNKGEDFMDLMLNVLDQNDLGRDSDAINKATCSALVLAGSDTTGITLTWALSVLVNHPHVLKKAQDELDIHVGRERQVRESDIGNLVYLQAIVKEILRLYPPGPIGVPHESMEDCTIAGYHIPKGTMVFINILKIHQDPRVWSDPCDFQPERFLTTYKGFDVRGQSYKYIPFGNGRRMCAGISFAMQLLLLTLASLLHAFDFSTPTSGPVDMTESIGLANVRATPLNLIVNPRLQSHLYQ